MTYRIIKPIKTAKDYKMALLEVEKIFDAKSGTKEADLLDVLTTLIEVYEEKHYKVDFPDPIAAIEYWMESRGLERKDLEPLLGSRARVSEILNRKRDLSLTMIRHLNSELDIPAEILIKKSIHHHARH